MAARIAAFAAAAIVAAVAALYLYAVRADGDADDAGSVAVFALALAASATLAGIAPFVRSGHRRFGFLATAAVLTAVLAVVSGFSVGPLLVPAVLLLVYAAFGASFR
ncbi:MAG: hypothetical protein M3310_05055 [Actinomycetota bacterium]|nr:hypothetical protein [Actinomycetota bacterium]